jgi:two-component system, OmpR family, response regulator MprA
MNPRILLVEDEPSVRLTVTDLLVDEGYDVETASDGPSGLKRASEEPYDVVLLDIMLPGMNGLDVCRELRRMGKDVAVLMLTARGQLTDKVVGLKLGADDYLVKPFALGELLARVRALLRRMRPAGEDAPLWFAGLSLDRQMREASRGGRTFELTRTEYALLELFLRNPRRVLTRELIMERIWSYDFGPTSNPLEVYISYLRRKTEAGGEPRLIHTVRGVGYTLRAP